MLSCRNMELEWALDCPTLLELVVHVNSALHSDNAIDLSRLTTLRKLEAYGVGTVKIAPLNRSLRKMVLHGVTAFRGDVSTVCVLELARCSCSSFLIDACKANLRELCLANPQEEVSFVINADNLNVLILASGPDSTSFVQEVSSSLIRPLEALLLYGPVFEASAYDGCATIHTRRLLLGGASILPNPGSKVELSGVLALAIIVGSSTVSSMSGTDPALAILELTKKNLQLFATDLRLSSLPEMPNLRWLGLPDLKTFENVSPHLRHKLDEVGLLSGFFSFGQEGEAISKGLFSRWSYTQSDYYESLNHFWITNSRLITNLPSAYDLRRMAFSDPYMFDARMNMVA